MNATYTYRLIIWLLIGLALFSIGAKWMNTPNMGGTFSPDTSFDVSYDYYFQSALSGTTRVKTYIPQSNARQRIQKVEESSSTEASFYQKTIRNNLQGVWETNTPKTFAEAHYAFRFEGKAARYELPVNFQTPAENLSAYLRAETHIQSNDRVIDSLATALTTNLVNDLERLRAIFSFANNIPSAPIITLTDALATLEQNRASCNGKSRLLVALARNLGYPSRIKGGIILEKANKRTSHAWVEMNINGEWVPFDALNGHFGYLPANYLELYTGDEFLITYTSGINFDYSYNIEPRLVLPLFNTDAEAFGERHSFTLVKLLSSGNMSLDLMLLLLSIPIGGLLVAFLRNIIGLQTFGVFLPVLIALSLVEVGFQQGLFSFLLLTGLVGFVAQPLVRFRILSTPKQVVLLSVMVLFIFIGSFVGQFFGLPWLSQLAIFPIIVMTVAAERFSSKIIEDGTEQAIKPLVHTILTILLCYWVLAHKDWVSMLILFPEMILLILAGALFLGRYVGFRVSEFIRFRPIVDSKKIYKNV